MFKSISFIGAGRIAHIMLGGGKKPVPCPQTSWPSMPAPPLWVCCKPDFLP